MDHEGFVEMKVGGLTLDPVTKTPIVILKDSDNKLNLPIWIGLMEATSMATELEGIKMARPMTHDLLRDLVEKAGGVVESIEVTSLQDNTYYATIRVKLGDRDVNIDSRPSDAIAIALRTNAPIFVENSIMDDTSNIEIVDEMQTHVEGDEEEKGNLENKLKKAVELEKYEEAAIIRDQLKEFK